jgi:hypothetical protein
MKRIAATMFALLVVFAATATGMAGFPWPK